MGCNMHESDPPPYDSMRALSARAYRLVTMNTMSWYRLSIDGGCMAWWCMNQKSNAWLCMA